jgi:putative acetyltransferase
MAERTFVQADLNPIRIRRARDEDVLKIRNAHVASIRTLCARDYTPEQIAAWIANIRLAGYREAMREGEVMFVAEQGLRIAGFSGVHEDQVQAVYVHPRFIRRGVGSLLLRAAEEEAQARGVEVLRLTASLTAVPFYRSQGYEERGAVWHPLPSGALLPCIRMAKRLGEVAGPPATSAV